MWVHILWNQPKEHPFVPESDRHHFATQRWNAVVWRWRFRRWKCGPHSSPLVNWHPLLTAWRDQTGSVGCLIRRSKVRSLPTASYLLIYFYFSTFTLQLLLIPTTILSLAWLSVRSHYYSIIIITIQGAFFFPQLCLHVFVIIIVIA